MHNSVARNVRRFNHLKGVYVYIKSLLLWVAAYTPEDLQFSPVTGWVRCVIASVNSRGAFMHAVYGTVYTSLHIYIYISIVSLIMHKPTTKFRIQLQLALFTTIFAANILYTVLLYSYYFCISKCFHEWTSDLLLKKISRVSWLLMSAVSVYVCSCGNGIGPQKDQTTLRPSAVASVYNCSVLSYKPHTLWSVFYSTSHSHQPH